jgi:hypothetical protein
MIVRPGITQHRFHSGAAIETGHLLYERVPAAPIRATPLYAAAFGDRPDAAVLPVAADRSADPEDRWLAAVVLGGQGRYAAAAAALRDLRADRRWASLAASTAASHARQVGCHAYARRLDAAALRAAGSSGGDAESTVDALLGLAADAIGLGRPVEARRLHAAAVARTGTVPWRTTVRIDWVATEVAMATGRATDAVAPAERALAAAEAGGGVRHTVKSTMMLGAVLTAGGTPDGRRRAKGLLTEALGVSLTWGMFSLTWPSALLLAELAPDEQDHYQKIASDALTSVYWWSDAAMRPLMVASPWLPRPLIRSGEHTRSSAELTT